MKDVVLASRVCSGSVESAASGRMLAGNLSQSSNKSPPEFFSDDFECWSRKTHEEIRWIYAKLSIFSEEVKTSALDITF